MFWAFVSGNVLLGSDTGLSSVYLVLGLYILYRHQDILKNLSEVVLLKCYGLK